MKSSIRTLLSNLLVVTLLFILSFCSKTGSDPGPTGNSTPPTSSTTSTIPLTPLTITSIKPTSGGLGTVIVITGTGFSTAVGGNTVTLNNKPIELKSSSTDGTTLTLTVPKGVGTGPISITTNNKTVIGPTFTYELSALISTLAGTGRAGETGGVGTNAQFNLPTSVAVDVEDNLYVTDSGNNLIRKIDLNGLVSTLAGTNFGGIAYGQSIDGIGAKAGFKRLNYIALNQQGDGYVADSDKLRKVSKTGTVTTISLPNDIYPVGIATSSNGDIYLASGNQILKISASGIAVIAGNKTAGVNNGIGSTARFNSINGLAFDPAGFIYVADTGNHLIRKIALNGAAIAVTTLAGSMQGFANGIGTEAKFDNPTDVKIGLDGNLYVLEYSGIIRKIIISTGQVSHVAGYSGICSRSDGVGVAAHFCRPLGFSTDSKGNIYVADTGNHLIRKISFE